MPKRLLTLEEHAGTISALARFAAFAFVSIILYAGCSFNLVCL